MGHLLALLASALLLQNNVKAEEGTCFTSALCQKGDMHETVWRQVSSPAKCEQSSPVIERDTYIDRIGRNLNRTLGEFFIQLVSSAADDCQQSSSKPVSPISVDFTSGPERCFAPVVCQIAGTARTDFMQIHAFSACIDDKKETGNIFQKAEKSFKDAKEYLLNELRNYLFKSCKLRRSPKADDVIKKVERYQWKIPEKHFKGRKECYAPVVCSTGGGSFENWMKVPQANCDNPEMILRSEQPEYGLELILQVIFEDLRQIIREGCWETSNESIFPTTNFPDVTLSAEVERQTSKQETTTVSNPPTPIDVTTPTIPTIITTATKTTATTTTTNAATTGFDFNFNSSVCEGNQLTLSCPDEKVINTVDANYGNTDNSERCGIILTTSCGAVQSTSVVRATCDNRQSCSVWASNSIFGDPCPVTVKSLSVQYKCIDV